VAATGGWNPPSPGQEAEMAEVCGVLNAAMARLVGLIARVLASEAWHGWGIRWA
jgi:hypothetical protein